ncbi:hypothetical protein TNCV_2596891 [Trichonephila clavipes]|nr:hypothetical protein TNCV_2596891 [Trichonephila clavipes]
MAAIDVDASFRSLEDCFENLENVLNCAGNPSKKLREDARTALGKLKSYILKSVNGSADLKIVMLPRRRLQNHPMLVSWRHLPLRMQVIL